MRERTKTYIELIMIIFLITLPFAALFIFFHFWGYERSIRVDKDAYVYEYYPDNNFGSDNYLRVGNYHFGKVQTYYHFNISSLPGGWRDANIIVKFDYGSDFVNIGANLTYESWDEMSISWNNKPNESIYRGWILCDGFNFRIPIRSDHIINDGVSVCLYGRGGVDDGYIQGNSKEGASSKSDIAVLELSFTGIDPIILTGLSIGGIVFCIIMVVIGLMYTILIRRSKSNEISKNRIKPMNINNLGGDWLIANQNISKMHRSTIPTIEKEINQYITLKLEHGRTYVYVNGKRFIQCIRLVLNIPKSDVQLYDEVDSIDEAAKLYSNHIHQNRIVRGPMAVPVPNQVHNITPEEEFWGHCSNIQAWVEHDYDTRILMKNISFPLLRELVKAGDPKASKIFIEEIAQRLESGFPSVVQYLLNQGYLGYINLSELETIIESTELIKNLSSNPMALAQFLIFCVSKYPTLVENILIQILKLSEGKEVIIKSMNLLERTGMPYLRHNYSSNPEYLQLLKNALQNIFSTTNDKINKDIKECIQAIEKRMERQENIHPSFLRDYRSELFKKLFLNEEMIEDLDELGNLFIDKKLLGDIERKQSRCAFCRKVIPKGQEVCKWCGHKKDDNEGGFFPFPFIFKPPEGGGGGRLKEVALVIPIKSQ